MKLNQLSVFLENKPGQLSAPCRVLSDAGISILTLSLADTHQFGILRIVVEDWEQAKSALEQANCIVNVTSVVAVEVEDKPGGLAGVLEVIDSAEINLEYMYAFTFRKDGRAVLIFRFENPDAAIAALDQSDVMLIDAERLFELSKQ